MPSSKVYCEDEVKEYHSFMQQIFYELIQRARVVLSSEDSSEQNTAPWLHGEGILMGRVKQ